MTTTEADDASPSPEHSVDPEESDMADQKESRLSSDASPAQETHGTKTASSSNAKDPLRPRRKKARRACFACQRAHLTCGDERPCHRCIKRGLQDACADGVRKKAKYLHDAPPEALMPGIGGQYHHSGNQTASMPGPRPLSNPPSTSVSQHPNYYQQAHSQNFGIYPQNSNHVTMAPSMHDTQTMGSYSNQQTPISPSFNQVSNQRTPPMQNMTGNNAQSAQQPVSQMNQFGGPLFDPSDPALFNLDIASLNFGNHYGALEFGMLGHMASGTSDTPPGDNGIINPLNQAANVYNGSISSGSYNDSSVGITAGMTFGAENSNQGDWRNVPSRHGSMAQIQTPNNTPVSTNLDGSLRQDLANCQVPHAYAIQAGPSSLASASPASNGQEFGASLDANTSPSSPVYFVHPSHTRQHLNPYSRQQQQQHQQHQQQQQQQQHQHQHVHMRPSVPVHPVQWELSSRKRRRDTTAIYSSITKPYSYTSGFHRLVEVVRRRFPGQKTLRIAKAIASIRPSFIACTRLLQDADLVFMEQALQRTLVTFEDHIESVGTPTLVIRRTGEVVAAGKEFSILTGWKRDVLLGKEANLNINTSGSCDGLSGTSSATGLNTPRTTNQEPVSEDPSSVEPRPVSVAELFDGDSVVQFWEDFAKLAFNDSRGEVQRPCKLLKYRTREQMTSMPLEQHQDEDKKTGTSFHLKSAGRGDESISNEVGISKLGESEGVVQCMSCWCITRDNFDMPMLIVINFLPIL